MSTANKLSYLNDTKSLLRTSLNKFGSNILSTDTFRSYDTKLNEIYDKLPKVTATGQGLTITPVQNGLLDDFKMNGVDLEQDTTNGNQLLNFNLTPTKTPATTSTFIDDTLTVSSSSGTYKRVEWDILSIIKNNPSRVIKFGKQSYSSTSNVGNVQLRIKINNTNTYVQILNNNYTIPSDTTTITEAVFQVYSNNSETSLEATTTIVKPLLYFDNNNTYEPYTNGASPNPDYPQDIKVVEGRQVIIDKGKNLLKPHAMEDTNNGITVSYDEETRVYTFNGTCTENNTTFVLSDKSINFIAGVTKSITYWVDGSCTNYCYIRHYDSSYASSCTYSILNISSANNKIEQTSNASFVSPTQRTSIRFNNGSVANNFKIKVMVTDDENTDYEPYHDPVNYNIDLQLANIYLAKMPNTNYKNRIYKNNGNWYFEEKVKKIVLDGSEDYYEYSINEDIIRFQPRILNDLAIPLSQYVSNNFKYLGAIAEATETGISNGVSTTNSRCFIFILKSIASNTENFKTWLSTHNTEIWYALVTPVTTQITNTTLINQLEAISVHTGTNTFTISNNNNIIPEIEITRLKELEKLA